MARVEIQYTQMQFLVGLHGWESITRSSYITLVHPYVDATGELISQLNENHTLVDTFLGLSLFNVPPLENKKNCGGVGKNVSSVEITAHGKKKQTKKTMEWLRIVCQQKQFPQQTK